MNWNDVVDQLGPALFRYFLGSFPRHLADELVQETFIRLVRKVDGGEYDSSKGSLLKFSYGIARFVKLEAFKSLPQEIISDEAVLTKVDDARPSDEVFGLKDQVVKLRRALVKLPNTQREILILVLDDEMSFSEISEILEMPVGTIKSHVHRAKEKLFEILRSQEKVNEGSR